MDVDIIHSGAIDLCRLPNHDIKTFAYLIMYLYDTVISRRGICVLLIRRFCDTKNTSDHYLRLFKLLLSALTLIYLTF